MKMLCSLLVILMFPFGAAADPALVDRAISAHIIPRFQKLAATTQQLAQTAQQTCDLTNAQVLADYNAAFDAWIGVSHLRFGPTEQQDRAFALAFWPDTRGKTPKALRKMITAEDPIAQSGEGYKDASIAVRGFYAMEFLLYDGPTQALGHPEYQCALFRAMTTDTAKISRDILDDWQPDYAALLLSAGQNTRYQSEKEALQELYKAVVTGFQFTKDMRLGRPLGSFDKPRPNRAEARRAGRSLRNVKLATDGPLELARLLAGSQQSILDRYDVLAGYFDKAVEKTDDPVFAGVSDPLTRIKIEVIQQSVDRLMEYTQSDLGPYLGVSEGFNALDGD